MVPRIWTLVGVALLAICFSETGIAEDVASIVKEADTCVSQRHFDRALALYERAQAEGMRFENDLPHASSLSAVYLNTAPPDLASAIKWLQVAGSLAPQSDSLRLQLASSLGRSGNFEAAIDQYKVLAEAHPTSADYAIQLATELRQAGKSDVALQFLQASTEKYPSLVAFRIEYARQLNFAKQYPEARKQFSAALAIAPQNLIAQVGLAKATSYEGDQETAIEMYDRILQRHPGSYDAIVGKAFSLLWSGRTEQAAALLRQASVRNPGDNEVREALSTLPHSAGVPMAAPTSANPGDPIRRLEYLHRPALRRPPNAEMPGSNPAPNPAPPEHPLPQQDQQHGNGVAVGTIGFFCLMLAPILYGRSRSHRFKSRACEREGLRRERTSDVPLSNVERNSRNSSMVIEPVPEPVAAVGAITQTPEEDRIRPDVLAEQAVSDIAGQQVHEHSHSSAPHLQGISSDQMEAAGTSDDRVGSRQQSVAAEQSEAKAKLKVLLVGGRPHEIQLQSQWFPIEAAEILWERNWAAALRCLAIAPPDLLVLNTLTDDGRTSQQMFDWIVTNRAEFRDRTIAIHSRADSRGRERERSDAHLVEPFGAPQWRQAVMSAVHPSEVISRSDKPTEPLGQSHGEKIEPPEQTFSELRTLLCSATSFGPLVEANSGPPAGSY